MRGEEQLDALRRNRAVPGDEAAEPKSSAVMGVPLSQDNRLRLEQAMDRPRGDVARCL